MTKAFAIIILFGSKKKAVYAAKRLKDFVVFEKRIVEIDTDALPIDAEIVEYEYL